MMVILRPLEDGRTELRFAIERSAVDGAASVVGDFNGWEPGATPLFGEGDELSAVAVCETGRYEYRILCEGCGWLDDPSADGWSEGPHGIWNAVVEVGAIAPINTIDLRADHSAPTDELIDVRGPEVVVSG